MSNGTITLSVCTFRGTGPKIVELADTLIEDLKDEVRRLGADRHFTFGPIIDSFDELARSIQTGTHRVLQIVSHASGHGDMPIEDVWGEFKLAPEGLIGLLKDNDIDIVLVNTCHGAVIAELLIDAGAVRAAVGIEPAQTAAGARAFTRAFIRSLAMGQTIEKAFANGKGQAAGRLHQHAELFSLFPADGEVSRERLFSPPDFYLIGHPTDGHVSTVQQLRQALAPCTSFHVDDTQFGDDETEEMLGQLAMAKVIMVLFEGHRVRDARLLEEVVRAVERAARGKARVFPLYLEGTTDSREVPFGLLRVKAAFLQGRKYRGDVTALARDLIPLAGPRR